MNSPNAKPSCDEVLADFATSEEGITHETLHRFTDAHPEYAKALRELFETLELEQATEWPADEEVIEGRSLEERVQEMMLAVAAERPSLDPNPFAGRSPRELNRLATDLGVGPVFLMKLKDRTVEGATIPSGFVVWLATAMGKAAEDVRSYLAGETRMATGMAFKSSVRPQQTSKQSFQDALETSNLSEEQKRTIEAACRESR